jgi:hypothetical protein
MVRKLAVFFVCLAFCSASYAEQFIVSNDAQLDAAFAAAVANGSSISDEILLSPGTYQGGIFVSGLNNVTIRSLDAAQQAVIQGGSQDGLLLRSAVDVTVQDLQIRDYGVVGLHFDDGGAAGFPGSASRNITVRNVAIDGAGSNDGMKMSGVIGFHVDGVRITNWSTTDSGFDMIGSHNGLVENSFFSASNLQSNGYGIRAEGGSKNIVIRANRVEMPSDNGDGNSRAIQLGGATQASSLRFIDGDSGYEANNVTVEGNIVIGGGQAFTWVNIDGGVVHHNIVQQPDTRIFRIQNENQGSEVVDTQNGSLLDNIIIFDNGLSNTYSNSAETQPNTFSFARNQWFNVDNPANSTPNLPAPEIDGVVGVDPQVNVNDVIGWSFDWGIWLVNATDGDNTFQLDGAFDTYFFATFGADSEFAPLLADPLVGDDWVLTPLTSGTLQLGAFSQAILVNAPTAVPLPAALPLLLAGLAGLSLFCRRSRWVQRRLLNAAN